MIKANTGAPHYTTVLMYGHTHSNGQEQFLQTWVVGSYIPFFSLSFVGNSARHVLSFFCSVEVRVFRKESITATGKNMDMDRTLWSKTETTGVMEKYFFCLRIM